MSDNRDFIRDVAASYPDCLRDESRRVGRADSISFPRTQEELGEHLRQAGADALPVTVQGARTGIAGGATPDGGHALNLSRLARIGAAIPAGEGEWSLTVEPGATLEQVRTVAAGAPDGPLFFPPDPTEATASIGGMIGCNASGARTFLYGPTRAYVRGLRVFLADGHSLRLRRGRNRADGGRFAMTTEQGRRIEGTLPSCRLPAVKNACGYYSVPDMDLLDLFIGSEGTLGVVGEADLRLIRAPGAMWGVQAFFADEAAALNFVERARGPEGGPGGPRPAALEFFDSRALDLLRERRRRFGGLDGVPEPPSGPATAVYVEFHAATDDEAAGRVERLAEAIADLGGDADAAWVASEPAEMERLKAFRHAVPESVNAIIDERRRVEPALTKLGTDFAVPHDTFKDVMAMYHRELDAGGFEYVMFGHAGDSHVHVNILPRDMREYEAARSLYLGWARRVAALGGTVSAEHGIGKLKKALFALMVGADGLAEMRALKRTFDPEGRLNPGNLL